MKLPLSPFLAVFIGFANLGIISAFELVSVDPLGAPIEGESGEASVSDDGRFVAFRCGEDLVAEDTNGRPDIYVRDRLLKTTTLISVTPGGIAGNASSGFPKISGDGSTVVFTSIATDLVPEIDSGQSHVYVRNLSDRTTSILSVDASGAEGDGYSSECTVSRDGTKVAFSSYAENLVPSDNNEQQDIFVVTVGDRGSIERVSIGKGGDQANGSSEKPAISADGKFVVFQSYATLVDNTTLDYPKIFRKDLSTGEVIFASRSFDDSEITEDAAYPSISGDGSKIVFESEADNLIAEDSNGEQDIFLYNADDDSLSIISRAGSGDLANDYNTISDGNAISNDGRFVVFESDATNLTDDPVTRTNLFRLDRQTGRLQLISQSSSGAEGDGPIISPTISGDGQTIVFGSQATNLSPNATSGVQDLLAWPGPAARVVLGPDNTLAKAKLAKKIRKLKKKMKSAKRKKQIAKAKKLKKKIKKLSKRLRSL